MSTHPIFQVARNSGRLALSEQSGKLLLSEFGIPVPNNNVVSTPGETAAALVGLRAPFIVKVMSDEILHKSDAGGVIAGLDDADAVAQAISYMVDHPKIREARVDGYLVEEMVPGGTEIVVGAVRDPQFGHLVMVGIGGIFVEVLNDVSFRICPIDRSDAIAMLDELRGAEILEGTRGRAGINKNAIVDILIKVGGENGLLMIHGNEIAELDLNPIIANSQGAIAVDARIILADPVKSSADAPPKPYDHLPVLERYQPLVSPKTVAVLGASATSTTIANTFIRRMKDFGYSGAIYPIHPTAQELEGLPCYPNLTAAPEPIDYAYIAVGGERIPDILAGANGRVRFAQVISSGFGEVEEGRDLQEQLVAKAHAGGCRILGPNCLGLYSPRGGVTFPVDAPKDVGTVGVVSQSGGLSTDIIKRGQWRGIRFSGLVTAGNSADLGPVDLLEFFLEDPQTRIIGLYLEDVKDGHRFFELLKAGNTGKPVIILRGGRSALGRVAAASHTGALASDERVWEALSHQTGCVQVETVDEFIGALLAFQFLEPRPLQPTRKVVLFGNGGGTSVLATDYFSRRGLEISPFEGEALSQLEAMALPPGTSVINPIDTPVGTLQEEKGKIADRILDIIYKYALPDAVVMHLNLAAFVGRGNVDPVGNLIKAAVRVQKNYPGQSHFVMVLRVDGSPELDAEMRKYRTRALSVGIPVYDELAPAAEALRAVSWVERHAG